MEGIKKKYLLFIFIFNILILSGCGLYSPDRDIWYRERFSKINKLSFVTEGMTRQEVLERWGEPWKVNSEKDIWIYIFPDIVKEKTYVKFENDIVVKMWTSW